MTELATCGYAERGQNVVLQGPTGTGKTYHSCVLAKGACRHRIRAHYIRQPDLEETWRISREKTGGERKITREYASFQVLVLDERLLDKPDELFRGFLLELMEARYGINSTIFCTQFRKKDWHARLGGGVHAEAIMDRIIHNTAWVEMEELNMRQKIGLQ
ncbi:MAG: ATP-binding protein [Eggerthellaceae bacterium]|nr:ATP-binding protein [Eggerthellaceae bacterium]